MNFLSTHHFLYSCLNNFFEIEARNKESLNCTTPCVGLAQIRKANLPRPSVATQSSASDLCPCYFSQTFILGFYCSIISVFCYFITL
ncbi:hypothetical protein F3K31_26290 (plasmid) [Escherichia coli]|nr:hypothetical protein F3K31_26290 [Escherichia coli]